MPEQNANPKPPTSERNWHVGVIASAKSWYLADLQRAAKNRSDVKIVPLAFERMQAKLPGSQLNSTTWDSYPDAEHSVALHELDAVIVRTMPPGSLEQVVFRMDLLLALDAAGVLVVNPPKSMECTIDKFLTSYRLDRAGLQVPGTLVVQQTEQAMEAFVELGRDVVLKPLFGGEARGMVRLTDEDLAYRAFRWLERQGDVMYLQRFIPHPGHDIRVFVIEDECVAMKRVNALDWRTNVSRGAMTEPVELNDQWRAIALAAQQAVGTWASGVDLLPGQDGIVYVLEVNGVPGWQRLTQTLKRDIAGWFLDALVGKLKRRLKAV